MVSDEEIRPAPLQTSHANVRGMSLRARLAFGFASIALLFLAANYLNQRDATKVTTRIEASTRMSGELSRAARAVTDSLAKYQQVVLDIDAASNNAAAVQALHAADSSLAESVKAYDALDLPLGERLPPSELNE